MTNEEKIQLCKRVHKLYHGMGALIELIDKPISDTLADNTLINIDELVEYLHEIANERPLAHKALAQRRLGNYLWETTILRSDFKG